MEGRGTCKRYEIALFRVKGISRRSESLGGKASHNEERAIVKKDARC
jgi:hypothetical protein